VRDDLARLFTAHKASLGMLDWSDEQIVAQTNDIVGALIACGIHATAHGDQAWMERHQWFGEAVERLLADQHAVPLDG